MIGASLTAIIAIVTIYFQLTDPLYRPGIIGVAIWYIIAIIYFAAYGRKTLVFSPEEEFAVKHREGAVDVGRAARAVEKQAGPRGRRAGRFSCLDGRMVTIMAGMLTFKELQTAVGKGEIDTVLVAFPDMQGRLVGKRMQAEYFLEGAHEETHGCDYLLANDIDMEPVPGYAAANWEKGYGDFVMKPDMATLRRLPWLPGTALVLADILDHHHHEDVPHAPRAMLKRQIERLKAMKMSAFFASELEFYLFDETYESAADKNYADLRTAGRYIEDYHILQTTKEEGVMRAIRTGLEGAGIPVENSKGEWGPGQEEINVRYATRSPWPTGT